MSKLAGKMRNVATQTVSRTFTNEDIFHRSWHDTHNGESMQQIYAKIMSDPNLRHEDKGNGKIELIYESDGKSDIIGWYDTKRMMGEISETGYQKLQDLPDSYKDNFYENNISSENNIASNDINTRGNEFPELNTLSDGEDGIIPFC